MSEQIVECPKCGRLYTFYMFSIMNQEYCPECVAKLFGFGDWKIETTDHVE